jgi:hypothetical protein
MGDGENMRISPIKSSLNTLLFSNQLRVRGKLNSKGIASVENERIWCERIW